VRVSFRWRRSRGRLTLAQVVSEVLQALLRTTFVVLAVATALSVLIGWWMAGRMLRPVHEISAVARSLSAKSLHERIGLEGPADELKELADTFYAMVSRLETAFVAQREFVSNASHELRTPLAIMRTEIDVTLAEPEADVAELRRIAETIRSAIARSEDVIDKLLVLAESEDLTEHAEVDLARVLDVVVAQHARDARVRGLGLRLDARAACVDGDEVLLERLVDNLVDNAVRYASAPSEILVDVHPAGDVVVLSVANGGDAIGADEVARLFERFYRRGTSRTRRAGGSGLGLAIVAAVAEAHGGTATAEAPSEGGLTVTVTLPRLTATRSAEAAVSA